MRPIDHSEDLIRLQNDGVVFTIVGENLLVVPGVPYLNPAMELKSGTLVMPLVTSGESVLPPSDHTADWAGEHPSNTNGSPIHGLVNGHSPKDFGHGLLTDYFLSCKPVTNNGRYKDFYDKVTMYLHMISAPALAKYPDECKKMEHPVLIQNSDSPFVYGDTNASRAYITGISERLAGWCVAIIGLGGTGSYLLDALSKCPVSEIHLYDDDTFATHNAFRAPGAASVEKLNKRMTKVQYFGEIYGNMHKGIIAHPVRITRENMSELDNLDFVFICVDSGSVRAEIANHLADLNKPFIDSGLGFTISGQGKIVGQIRVTTGFQDHYDHLRDSFGSEDSKDDLYASNIQVAELNAIAAEFMILKWKRMLGFYGDMTSADDANAIYAVQENAVLKMTDDDGEQN